MSAYVELHAHSCFSLLDGASTPEELVTQAAALGMPALALTDHDAVYGAPRFVRAAAEAGIKPILGAELTLHDGVHLTVLARDTQGWHNLCTLITAARHAADKGLAALPHGMLETHTAGLIALSGCRRGRIPAALLQRDDAEALKHALHYKEVFAPEGFWIELQHHRHPEDNRLNAELADLAAHIGVGVVATNNVHYATRDHRPLHDVLACIRDGLPLDEHPGLRTNAEYALKSGAELAPLFARTPQALSNTLRIAEQCTLELAYGLQSLPAFTAPDGLSAEAYLAHLCREALAQRGLPASAQSVLDHELAIINASGLANYFLIVWDIVQYARREGILCQGRGSAANSLAAYLLGISPVNPLAHDLVFERFLSAERQAVPDIDIDFDAARREEVIQYVYARYGLAHAAMACTFVTFRARSAIRDVGKAFGLPPELLDPVSAALEVHSAGSLPEAVPHGIDLTTWTQVITLSRQLDGFPRHLGIHNGGMVICGGPLAERVPTEPATMAERFVTQWDKDGLEDLGLVKIDLLGLRMLSAVADTVRMVGECTGITPDLEALSFDDPAVYDMICAADTVGVFQVESRAQAQVLPRLRPRTFNDLIVSISLIRPGPVQGDMVHPYLRRRLGQEPVTYPHPRLEAALGETLGVILFQEQVLKVARDLAGFTPGQGELLRRALGAKNPGEAVDRFHTAFIDGAQANGVDRETAEGVFNRLRAFGGYAFPKSHAAAFAVLVYRSAWLKCYHPAAFFAALLNHQPMGFWSPAVLVNDARRHSMAVLPVDIHHSHPDCLVESGGIRLGFNSLREFTAAASARIVAERAHAPFTSLADFTARTHLPRRLVEHLIAAGAMAGWQADRRALLWSLGTLSAAPAGLGLTFADEPVTLPALTAPELAGMELHMTGVSTGDHPLAGLREPLRARGLRSSADLPHLSHGAQVTAAGLLVVHQAPPTARGYRFLTLEDEHGFINVIVRPKVYARFRRVIRAGGLLTVTGQVQHEGGVSNMIAATVSSL